MNSQVQIFSNLMLDDKEHKPHYKWMPGDLVAEIYKEFLNPPELMHRHLTPQQEREYLQYLPCLLCGRSCAGTCGKSPTVDATDFESGA
jgi:hypothetical protein